MIKIPPCDLPMVPLAAENVQGFLVTIGKNGTNGTIGRFSDFTIGRTPNVANKTVSDLFQCFFHAARMVYYKGGGGGTTYTYMLQPYLEVLCGESTAAID